MYAQTAINGEHNPAALFMLIQISDSGMAALKQQITAFYEKRHVLTRANPANQVTTALALVRKFGKNCIIMFQLIFLICLSLRASIHYRLCLLTYLCISPASAPIYVMN